ncbi:CTD nuclear envelope phosphatase 1 [Nematocida displodere]|uniref:Mitochondrial import inner membrane translocase subunit TIM50 n=1 Tax=Nematocida displodere TaxID=1805483 RepID=A0A177EJJ4_9MICR|nr:CTD nuclear envelope phosphatase 1 [Nematocida displodere]
MRRPLRRGKAPVSFSLQTNTQWSKLIYVKNIREYIGSLGVWCFFSNYDGGSDKRYLALDFEGVILHSTIRRPEHRYDFFVQYPANGEICTHFITLRPMVKEFIESVSEWYHLVLYTTAEQEYADAIADKLEKKGKIFLKRLYRTDCDYLDGKYLRDPEKVASDLSSVVILSADYTHYNNKLPIDPYDGDTKDCYLLSTIAVLDSLRYCHDVRSILELANL